jgi:hypothetical protein
VVIRTWLVCGPFGGPGAQTLLVDPRDSNQKADTRAFCEAAKYPPDDGVVDPKAQYDGPQIRGYWPDPERIGWQRRTIEDLDTRIVLGTSGQTWYGATWVYAPRDMAMEFQFQSHPQTVLRFFLNGQLVQDGEIKAPPDAADPVRLASSKTLKLRSGWNQIEFRGYCFGYPPFRAGLVLMGEPQDLWPLRISETPPESGK